MNTKTTFLLAMVLVVLGAVYYVRKSRPVSEDLAALPAPGSAASAVARDLSEEPLGEVVRVVCQRKGKDEWVFEKTKADQPSAQDEWHMTAPLSAKCVKWEVDRFDRRLGNIQYEISYMLDQAGAPTLKEAGLDPPQAVVTLTDADGKSIGVEIGRAPAKSETYVRRVGTDEIVLAKSDLTDLFKDSALAYREKLLWSFDSTKATRVEIEDRSAGGTVSYALSKDGSRWMLESPVTARATTKVDDMLRAMANLRVLDWQENDATKLASYGLAPGSVSVRVTVEEQVPVPAPQQPEADAEAVDEEPTPTTETKTTTYSLVLSNRSPIGEDTKSYLRIAEENAVATVMKSVSDKFTPVMSEWRDMRLTSANLSAANKIELKTADGGATLVKNGDDWSFDEDQGRAESTVVSELLSAAADLSAVVFVDERDAGTGSYGFDPPRAELQVTVPGVEGFERFTVGGYTDEATKRLVYVRRGEGGAIAKVRTADIAKLIQAPRAYRDHTVFDVLPSRFEQIVLSSEAGFGGGRTEITLARTGIDWVIAAPVAANVRTEEVDKLMAQLGGLRAEAVVADASQISAFGLHTPVAKVTIAYKVVGDTGGESSEGATSRTIELAVAQHEGKYYAHLAGRGVIYEINKDVYTQLTAEYRTDRVLEFDDATVTRFSIRQGDSTHAFVKRGDAWIFETEPDLPLDAAKVKSLLLQLKDLRTPRYVKHAGADAAAFGLDNPTAEVTVSIDDGTQHVLLVSNRQGGSGAENGFYCGIKGRSHVFLLTADSVKRFEVSLGDLEASK